MQPKVWIAACFDSKSLAEKESMEGFSKKQWVETTFDEFGQGINDLILHDLTNHGEAFVARGGNGQTVFPKALDGAVLDVFDAAK